MSSLDFPLVPIHRVLCGLDRSLTLLQRDPKPSGCTEMEERIKEFVGRKRVRDIEAMPFEWWVGCVCMPASDLEDTGVLDEPLA